MGVALSSVDGVGDGGSVGWLSSVGSAGSVLKASAGRAVWKKKGSSD